MKKKQTANKITNNGKWKDIIRLKNIEVKLTILFTIINMFIFVNLNIYEEFSVFGNVLKSLTLAAFQSFIGLIGIIIAGVAVLISVFSREVIRLMRRINNTEKLRIVFNSFVFLAYIAGISVVIFIANYILLHSNTPINISLFYFMTLITVYLFYFVIFYTISLISNIVKLFFITNTYNEILDFEEEFDSEKSIEYIQKLLDRRPSFQTDEMMAEVLNDEELSLNLKIAILKIITK